MAANKKIKLRHNDEVYTLEFTKRSVKSTEARGFDTEALTKGSYTMAQLLIQGAFEANHRHLRWEKIEEILDEVKDVPGLIVELVRMFNEPLAGLFGGEDADDEKNGSWEIEG